MEVKMYCRALIFISTLIILVTVNVSAQSLNNSVSLKEKNLGGPRMGLTIIHGRGEIVNRLEANNMDRLVSAIWRCRIRQVYTELNNSFWN